MTKIWFAHDGVDPTTDEPKYERPFKQCVNQVDLVETQWFCRLDQRPVINEESPLPQDYQHVICRVDQQEASELGWEPGFYRLGVTPKEVANRLGLPG